MTNRKVTAQVLAVAMMASAFALGGCANVKQMPAQVAASAAAKTADLSTFYQLVQQAGLTSVVEGGSPVTVFAPSNEAFKALPAETLDKLAKDPELLKRTLSYHIVSGKVLAADVKENTTLPTVTGGKLNVSKAGDFVTVDDAMVSQADMPNGSGVIHIIDRVLTPPKK